MLKRILVPTIFALFSHYSLAEDAQATEISSNSENVAYISDNLFVYVHSGPGKNYRIVGSIDAGTQVSMMPGNENGFQQVMDDKGREVWIETQFVSSQPGLAHQLDELGLQLQQTQQALNDAQTDLPRLQQLNQALQAENQTLQQTIQRLEKAVTDEKQKALTSEQAEQHLMLTYGGAVGVGGLLIGVLLTLFLSRRKRYDGWA